jgi:hypothetical protein
MKGDEGRCDMRGQLKEVVTFYVLRIWLERILRGPGGPR